MSSAALLLVSLAVSVCVALPQEDKLVLQLDSSTLIPGRLKTWTDLSPHGNDAVAPDALTEQPLVLANVPQLSGRAAVYFDGDSDSVFVSGAEVGDAASVCMVMQLAPQRRYTGSSRRVVFGQIVNGGFSFEADIIGVDDPQPLLRLRNPVQDKDWVEFKYTPDGDYHAVCFVSSTTQKAMHRRSRGDSTPMVLVQEHERIPSEDVYNDYQYVFGWDWDAAESYRGGLAEVLVWTTALSDSDAADVLDLLHSKYLVRGDLEQRMLEVEKRLRSIECGHEYGGDACAPAADVETVQEISVRVDALANYMVQFQAADS